MRRARLKVSEPVAPSSARRAARRGRDGACLATARGLLGQCRRVGEMEQPAGVPMDQIEFAPENIETTEPKKSFRGPRGRGRGRGGRGYTRGKMRGRGLNGFGPIRRGMGRMRPYPDARGGRGAHGGPPFPQTPPIRGMMRMPFLPPPPPRYGIPPPPFPPPPPPPVLMGFRGRPPFPRGRGILPWPRGHFQPPGGFPNGPRAPAPPPPGRGQRWPGPPGGRYY